MLDLSNVETRRRLTTRLYPYWHPILRGRHLGFYRSPLGQTSWIARYKRKGGGYRQFRIGGTDEAHAANGRTHLSFEQALLEAKNVFSKNSLRSIDPDPPRSKLTELNYCPVGNVYTLGHALKEYLEWKKLSSAESHVYVIITLLNRHVLPRLGTVGLEDLSVEHFRACFQHVMETCPSKGRKYSGERQPLKTLDGETLRKRKRTANVLIMIVREALRLAWENSKTNNDRLWRSLKKFPNATRPRMVHLSRAECRTLLKCCAADLRNLVKGALYTGCRSVELLRMQTCDVGRDGFGVYVSPSKTHTPRFVYLPDEGMAFFLKMAAGKAPNDPLFTTKNGAPWKHHLYRFRIAVKAAKLPLGFSFHGLRHTYASQLVQAGAPLSVVAEQLGHANTVSVSRTYGHIAPQIREAEIRQRFFSLKSAAKGKLLVEEKRLLANWKKRFDAHPTRTYARILDLKSLKNLF